MPLEASDSLRDSKQAADTDVVHICIVEDHRLVSDSMLRLLEVEPDFRVMARCRNTLETAEALRLCPIDVILLDLNLGNESAFTVLDHLRQTDFAGRVIIVAALVSNDEAFRLLCGGVSGIFLKQNPANLLLRCIRAVVGGEFWLDQNYFKSVLKHITEDAKPAAARNPPLAPAERNVMACLLEGLSNKEIAERLRVRESSVKTIVQNLLQQHNVHSRSQLVRIALEQYRDELNL
ncbi:MAG TPA: response regulator transcription factor [Bryobacteraceae bacterium]|nr:response regulator transcription factor [Bryobacteraceae bacterium]